jgi:sugar (pentulose or hexulose) kinase
MEEVILIFDVGKTNKKVLLFNRNLKVILEEESRFEEVVDDEGFPCDDAQKLEQWIKETIRKYLSLNDYQIKGINITTYGATLVFLDAEGKRLTPIYNYLKPIPGVVLEGFYESHGGMDEFSRRTASPVLGMLNSGLQLLWLKRSKPEVFGRVHQVLHLPQYLTSLVHDQAVSEHTSIGCHTMMWDFDRMEYHPWLKEEGISLPDPVPVWETFPIAIQGQLIEAGVGIHDSSSSLAPYIMAAKESFILVSTGTWCISMNPFNHEPLTAEELREDCLCFLGVHGKPIKSSRFFLGRIHELNVKRIQEHFKKEESAYKHVDPGTRLISETWKSGEGGQKFFRKGIPEGWVDFNVDPGQFGSFEEAYTRLMVDLSRQVVHAIEMIIAEKDTTKHLYVTGGFARNSIFTTILSLAFPNKQVYISEVDNATSLGAALVMAESIWEGVSDLLDLGLTSPVPHPPHR